MKLSIFILSLIILSACNLGKDSTGGQQNGNGSEQQKKSTIDPILQNNIDTILTYENDLTSLLKDAISTELKALRMANDDASKQQALANLKDKINKSRDAEKQTFLHNAVFNNQHKAVKALIAAGADLKAEDDLGATPLHYAKDPDVAQTLIAAGADIKAKTEDGSTPLHYAKDPDVAQTLIAAGADVTAKNNKGYTSLHYANTPALVQVLIEAGADVKDKDNDGYTPLHKAASLDRLDVVKALIAAGADVTAKNNKGQTPFDIAAENHYYKTRDYLASL